MYNNVIGGLHRALVQRGFSTLRFNFRGVGKSEGRYADGVGEKEDVRGAVEFAIEKADLPLFLVGYSFGAAVGTKAVVGDKRVKALLCISPPIAMYEFSSFKDDMRPKLFVAGDRDLVCPVKSLEEFFNALPQPKSIRIIQDVDHFWWGMEDRVADSVIDFLQGL
jgi:alpha/beta superfamily hydrolase